MSDETKPPSPSDSPAPDWLRAAGWIAAVVVGHLLLMNALTLRYLETAGEAWLRTTAGVICGQVTCLCIVGLYGPGLLFWRMAGALCGLALAGVLAFLALQGDQWAVTDFFATQLVIVGGFLCLGLLVSDLVGRIRQPDAPASPISSGQISLSQLLGLVFVVAVVCGISVNLLPGAWGRIASLPFDLQFHSNWSRGNALMGIGLAASVIFPRSWLFKVGVAIVVFFGLTCLEFVFLHLQKLLPWAGREDILAKLCWQNGAQTIVVLTTFLGLAQAGLDFPMPHSEWLSEPIDEPTSSPQ